jgi:hypothetical protein
MDPEASADLEDEAAVYASMHKKNPSGVPKLVGLYDDLDDGIHVLVTTDVGQSLDEHAEPLHGDQR